MIGGIKFGDLVLSIVERYIFNTVSLSGGSYLRGSTGLFVVWHDGDWRRTLSWLSLASQTLYLTMDGREGSGVRLYNVSCWWNAIKSANLHNWRKLSTIAKSKDGFSFLNVLHFVTNNSANFI